MPASEVCMHMKLTDTYMWFVVRANRMVQLYNADPRDRWARPHGLAITTGEAGLLDHDESGYYFFPHGLTNNYSDLRASAKPVTLS